MGPDMLSPFEKLTDLMTNLEELDLPAIYDILGQLCKTLRISKGVTTFYADAEHERNGEGESFVCYDSGEKHTLIASRRLDSPTGMVIVCDVYQAEGAELLTVSERKKVDIIQRMMLTCLHRPRQQRVIERLIYYDNDGYKNIRLFYSEIGRMLEQGGLAGITGTRLDLKHFSAINEQVGKENGDIVLRNYCKMLEGAMGDKGILCRLGGDNFVLLFPTEKLDRVTEVLKGVSVRYGESPEQETEISAFAGVCSFTENDRINNPGGVMERIIPPYQVAKRDNHPDIIFYDQSFLQDKKHAAKVQREFKKAMENENIVVYYQPKVDIRSRKIVGAEALCRWIRKGEIVPPIEFIPILERGNDICRLDVYMLDHVCRDIRRWLDEGKEPVRISVNLSRMHLSDKNLYRHIMDIIDTNRVPHRLIEIELTETTTDVEFRDLKRVVGELREAGIAASVDDFGVGYSSLNLIKQIPWDVLKLDKSILPSDADEVQGNRMFAHVIAMAHEMGLICVAEGVETEEQLEIMRNYGCRIAQGFLFDRPMPVVDFEKKLGEKQVL